MKLASSNDISNRTVVIILVIVILVSVASLGLYLGTIQQSTTQASSQGQVLVTIEEMDLPPQPLNSNSKNSEEKNDAS